MDEIRTYTPTEAQEGGEGFEPAPDGWYVVSRENVPTGFHNLRRGPDGILYLTSQGSERADSLFLDYPTFTGPISPDEIIPAVTEYRARQAVQSITNDPAPEKTTIALKARDALSAVLSEIRNEHRPKKKTAEMFSGDPTLPEIEWLADVMLLNVLGNLRGLERNLRKGFEELYGK